ncbi:MAG: hypothetical protein LBI88_04255 [Deltaproteobacteria bacterium]|jgi:hypothetical protein|nr:hypothetical protein [Deltaproteobacteria bacterium]
MPRFFKDFGNKPASPSDLVEDAILNLLGKDRIGATFGETGAEQPLPKDCVI